LGYSVHVRNGSQMPAADRDSERRRLAALLREQRERAGLSQVDVADRLEVHQSYVSKYESGERRIDLAELQDICSALGIRLVDLVRRFVAG
jgi:transcriptional regulator with XRE-family HTH domain